MIYRRGFVAGSVTLLAAPLAVEGADGEGLKSNLYKVRTAKADLRV